MYSFTVEISSSDLNQTSGFVMKGLQGETILPPTNYPLTSIGSTIINTQLIIQENYKEITGFPQIGYITSVNQFGETFTKPQITGFGLKDKTSTKIYIPRRLDFVNNTGRSLEYKLISTRKEEEEFIKNPERFSGIIIGANQSEQVLPLQNTYRIIIKKSESGSASNSLRIRLANFILFQQ